MTNPYANPESQKRYEDEHDRDILSNRDFYKRRDEEQAGDGLVIAITLLLIIGFVGLCIGYRIYFMR